MDHGGNDRVNDSGDNLVKVSERASEGLDNGKSFIKV